MGYSYEREKYYRDRKRVLVIEHLLTHPCVDCGQSDIRVLDFDHIRGKKINNISHMVRRGNTKWKIVEDEIAKCEVRCANCHRKRTLGEPLWFTNLEEFRSETEKLREKRVKPKPKALCGSRRKYHNGCRCELCTIAQRDYHRKWRERRRVAQSGERIPYKDEVVGSKPTSPTTN
jgi:hypothetical protein